MSGVGRFWTWISEPRTVGALGLLVAAVGAVVAALWQAFVYFAPPPHRPAPPAPFQAPAAAAPLATADVAGAERLAASQKRALDAETSALDKVARQIEGAGNPPSPPSAAHR